MFSSNGQDDEDMLKQMRNFDIRSNKLLRTFHYCSSDVKLELFKSYCTSFYCCYLWTAYKKINIRQVTCIGYEPADLTVHPTPELPRVVSFFSYRCLVFPKKVLKGKPVLFGIIEVKIPNNAFFLAYSLKSNFNNLNIFTFFSES